MNESKVDPFLKHERRKTDDSLDAERDKTNESIEKFRKKTELQTDTIVQQERDQTDQRNTADAAVELERTRIDAAIERERELKSATANHLLAQERKKTDKNLEVERAEADSKVHVTTSLLADEMTEHSKIKVSLTTRDEFLAIVSHDLKNPIGAASSCAEMLLDDSTFKGMDSKVRHWIEFIKRNVDVSLRLIADLLDMERIAQGKLQLKLEKHNIHQMIREAIETFSSTAAAKSILLRAMPADNVGDVVCDRDRIMQVLSNLIGNALKFTPDGGSVTLYANVSEAEVQISVRDTGSGIPLEKKNHIFDRFAQLGSNDRRGLGLGLYIAKMILEAHNGKVWVESKVGEGSTFFFTLPRLESKSDGLH
ncbi:MAG: HAMP domain-containing sensor histidine kinase [Bdellovibrionota bacterium]